MYVTGLTSAKSSAPNSGCCSAAASMRRASSNERGFCWPPPPGPATRRLQGALAWAAHGVSDQAPLRGRQFGAGGERGAASRSRAQTYRQERSLAGRNGLRQPPGGRARWTLKLLAGAIVELTD